MEFGERIRMTSPLRIPRSTEREVEMASTEVHTSEKERWWPVAASISAVVPWWGWEEMKVVMLMLSFTGTEIGLRLL